MSSTNTGRYAENIVAEQLISMHYAVVAQNWRTRWCEIDIVATKNGVVYFVEVKYRNNNQWGDGLDAITDKKLQQMTFAAEMWTQQNNWAGDVRLVAASVEGVPPRITELIEL
jgi:Holliday junction resolvase-like predicted endonuclease